MATGPDADRASAFSELDASGAAGASSAAVAEMSPAPVTVGSRPLVPGWMQVEQAKRPLLGQRWWWCGLLQGGR